jgi:hypothetical protein
MDSVYPNPKKERLSETPNSYIYIYIHILPIIRHLYPTSTPPTNHFTPSPIYNSLLHILPIIRHLSTPSTRPTNLTKIITRVIQRKNYYNSDHTKNQHGFDFFFQYLLHGEAVEPYLQRHPYTKVQGSLYLGLYYYIIYAILSKRPVAPDISRVISGHVIACFLDCAKHIQTNLMRKRTKI